MPGVIDTTTNYIEHPELVAQRIEHYTAIVGPERVMAGTDCGFGTWSGYGAVDPDICWAKLGVAAEGATRSPPSVNRPALIVKIAGTAIAPSSTIVGASTREERAMPNPGFIRGTHHLTFCVGGAQEDYDFHVRLLGLRASRRPSCSTARSRSTTSTTATRSATPTLLTAFPYRQAGWMGKRGTNQAKQLNLSVPADALGYWADRLTAPASTHERIELSAPSGSSSLTRVGSHYALVGDAGPDDRLPYEGGGVPGEFGIRGAYGTTTSVREVGKMDFFITRDAG